MKNEITHLPAEKQQELKELTHIVREYYPPVIMIILFGSYARGNWVEEKYEDNIHYRYQSDFDVLVITEDRGTRTQQEIEQNLEDIFDRSDSIKTPVSILVHDLEFINAHLLRTQYFFSDIKQEGILLYSVKQFQLQEPRIMSKQDRKKYAQEDFDFWFDKSRKFYKNFKFNLNENDFSTAAFMLHQSSERLYSTILLVYTRYKPNTHDLRSLRKMVNSIDDRFGQVFLMDNKENKQLFNLLRAAYVDARYKKTYTITHDELIKLNEEVKKLQALTESLCKEKIASFVTGEV